MLITTTTAPAGSEPLRAGERRVTVRMPAAYTPSAPTGVGTDDYRCFLLDPKITTDSYITGFNVRPGNPDVVHHVILFRVPPDLVAQAERKDAETPGQGWTCFGTSGLSNDGSIDDAPWLGAWAPGGSERVYGKGLGEQALASLRDGGWLQPETLLVLEEASEVAVALPAGFELEDRREYGAAAVHIISPTHQVSSRD